MSMGYHRGLGAVRRRHATISHSSCVSVRPQTRGGIRADALTLHLSLTATGRPRFYANDALRCCLPPLARLVSHASTENTPAPVSRNMAPAAASRKSSRAAFQPCCDGRLTSSPATRNCPISSGPMNRVNAPSISKWVLLDVRLPRTLSRAYPPPTRRLGRDQARLVTS